MPAFNSPFGGTPGPWVNVTFGWAGQSQQVLGILDTGADQTQVPGVIVQQLNLRPTGIRTVTSANNTQTDLRLYVADVEFDGRAYPFLEIVGSPLPIALIGRDILNTLFVEFDGPGLKYLLRP